MAALVEKRECADDAPGAEPFRQQAVRENPGGEQQTERGHDDDQSGPAPEATLEYEDRDADQHGEEGDPREERAHGHLAEPGDLEPSARVRRQDAVLGRGDSGARIEDLLEHRAGREIADGRLARRDPAPEAVPPRGRPDGGARPEPVRVERRRL